MSDELNSSAEPLPAGASAPKGGLRFLVEGGRLAEADGFVELGVDGALVGYSRSLLEVYGVSAEDRDALARIGDAAAHQRALTAAIARQVAEPAGRGPPRPAPAPGETTFEDVPLVGGRIVERYGVPLRRADGSVAGRLFVVRDVTARRRAEHDLRTRARQHEALADLGARALSEPDLHALLAEVIRRASSVLGADVHLLTAGVDGRLEPREPAASPRCALEGQPANAPLPAPGRGLACAPVQGRAGRHGVLCAHLDGGRTPSFDDLHFLETLAHVLGAAVGRHAAERALAEREREVRAVFEHTQDALATLDDAGSIVDANPAARRLLGARGARGGGPTWEAFEAQLRARWQELADMGRAAGELEVRTPGEPARTLEWSAVARILPGRHLAVLRDVTEARLVQARLALNERLASVGTLAGGLAHELNNPLASLFANVGFAQEELAPTLAALQGGAEVGEALREIREAAERMRGVVRDLQTFARGDESALAEVDVRKVVESSLSIAAGRLRTRARIVRDLGEVPPVRAVESRLAQVVLKLLLNAADAIDEGAADANEIRVTTRTDKAGRVEIAVADSGRGIPPEHLARVFDPFFTTKAPGEGSGLGLPVCHGLVRALGGNLEVASEPSRGTTFRVVLPPAAGAPGPAVEPARTGERRTVLVVDDEPLVGAAVRRALAGEHEVTVSTSAREALERLRGGERYDVILSDLTMPGMSGMELHDALSALDPAVAGRMLFMTGGAFTPAARAFAERLRERCVEKPFEVEHLRSWLDRLASRGAQG